MSYHIDHRQLADEMEIFAFDEQVGAGLPLWLPNGVAIRESLENFVKHLEDMLGYQRVVSPHIGKKSLFEASGHLRCFSENMYPPMKRSEEESQYYLRPMNCPHHHKIFASLPRSYRDLPLRLAEYGQVYRYENSGSLRGLIRARGLCQNDAHIYVDPAAIKEEVGAVLDLHEMCYKALGLKGYRYRLSKHDPKCPHDYEGDPKEWIQVESILRDSIISKGLPYFEAEREAAFYGPKVDVQMKVGPGEEESIASIQLDFNSASKFDLKFVAQSGEPVRPWIIHRAPLGSHERFIALLLEYYDGKLPAWLCPIHLYILPIGEEALRAAYKIKNELLKLGVRIHVDHNAGSLSKRILFAHKYRPFAKMVLGNKEVRSGSGVVQFRDHKEVCSLADLSRKLAHLVRAPYSS